METELLQLTKIVDEFFSELKMRFKNDIKITILVRNIDHEKADCVFTEDEFEESIGALKFLADKDNIMKSATDSCLQ